MISFGSSLSAVTSPGICILILPGGLVRPSEWRAFPVSGLGQAGPGGAGGGRVEAVISVDYLAYQDTKSRKVYSVRRGTANV